MLNAPLPQAHLDFQIVQYADDTLFLVQADSSQLTCLKALLNTSADSIGLSVNYSKSQMIPINLTPQRAESSAVTFGCQLGSLPFTYLGLPMGTTKPTTKNYLQLWTGWREDLSTITPITTYIMCTLQFYKGSIENIDRAKKQCIWRGMIEPGKVATLIWVLYNLYLWNDTLLLKHLHKFYTKQDIP